MELRDAVGSSSSGRSGMRGGIRVGGPGNRRRGLREGRWPGRLTVGVHASQRHAGQRRRTGWSSGLHREHAPTHTRSLVCVPMSLTAIGPRAARPARLRHGGRIPATQNDPLPGSQRGPPGAGGAHPPPDRAPRDLQQHAAAASSPRPPTC